MSISNENIASEYYAVIDLGSNSFHMLITRQLADSVQVVDKVKRKVRLGSGLDKNNTLSEASIVRGLSCLSFFAERLQDIPKKNVRIVATATVRIATNGTEFLARADKVLGQHITLLTGEQEAELIYLGVAHTNSCSNRRFVVDIGGASTELIVGAGDQVKKIISVDMGCVTYNQQYFPDGELSAINFIKAKTAALDILKPLIDDYCNIGWQTVLGGSGTMQALAEMLMFENKPTIITYEYLLDVQQQLLRFKQVENIKLNGLSRERVPVFVSGLAILSAIFESFHIKELQLSSGALREGLLYEMLPSNHEISIRQKTINSLTRRYHVNTQHADNVKKQAIVLFEMFSQQWQLKKDNSFELLQASCDLHEIGLLLEFKHHQKHSAYIIQHADLPGFDQADRQLISALVQLYKGDINPSLLTQSVTTTKIAGCLLTILRLAVILCHRRKTDALPAYQAFIKDKQINLCLPSSWLDKHPLIADELLQENENLAVLDFTLNIQCNN